MLLRSAKKFFKKSFNNFKSFFNGDNYEKLPKANLATTPSPFTLNPNPSSNNPNIHHNRAFDANNKLEKLYVDFTENGTRNRRSIRKKIEATANQEKQVPLKIINGNHQKKSNNVSSTETRKGEGSSSYPSCSRNRFLVLKKLKELEMMDGSNIDHVLDIEEVLHYYSLLTCPAYLEIVDKFFMEIYVELFASTTPTQRTTPSNPSSRVSLGIKDGARALRKVR